jgi:hypothetical protein
MLILPVIKATLKEINFPLFYEVVEDSDSFLAGSHAQQLHASLREGLTDKGSVKLQASSWTEGPFLALFLPSQLMHTAHFLKQFFGPGELTSHFHAHLSKHGVAF